MSVEDAKKAVDIGATAIMLSNHGGRQLDGSRSPFDQLPAIADAVGGKLEIILDGGIRRGSHVLKALSLGATACSFGKGFLFALGAGGQKGGYGDWRSLFGGKADGPHKGGRFVLGLHTPAESAEGAAGVRERGAALYADLQGQPHNPGLRYRRRRRNGANTAERPALPEMWQKDMLLWVHGTESSRGGWGTARESAETKLNARLK